MIERIRRRLGLVKEAPQETPGAEMPARLPAEHVCRRIQAASASSIGLERENNEDASFALLSHALGDDALPAFGIFCLADGAGGHADGEVASAAAVRIVAGELLRGIVFGLSEIETTGRSAILEQLMQRAYEHADRMVFENTRGGVTTLTSAALYDDRIGASSHVIIQSPAAWWSWGSSRRKKRSNIRAATCSGT